VFCQLKWRLANECKPSIALFYNFEFIFSVLPEHNLGSAVFDDHIAFKIAEELEDWKERQQQLFKAKVTNISKYYASDLLILGYLTVLFQLQSMYL
jgi:hypothetical protein